MKLSRRFALALVALAIGLALAGALAPGGAVAQTNNPQDYELKPFLPPVLPLPPNAQVNPGSLTVAPMPAGPAPLPFDRSQGDTPHAPGLTITVPTGR